MGRYRLFKEPDDLREDVESCCRWDWRYKLRKKEERSICLDVWILSCKQQSVKEVCKHGNWRSNLFFRKIVKKKQQIIKGKVSEIQYSVLWQKHR